MRNHGPASGFEFSFSFGNGFQGTDIFANDLYVTAYFVGPPSSTSGPTFLRAEMAARKRQDQGSVALEFAESARSARVAGNW